MFFYSRSNNDLQIDSGIQDLLVGLLERHVGGVFTVDPEDGVAHPDAGVLRSAIRPYL